MQKQRKANVKIKKKKIFGRGGCMLRCFQSIEVKRYFQP